MGAKASRFSILGPSEGSLGYLGFCQRYLSLYFGFIFIPFISLLGCTDIRMEAWVSLLNISIANRHTISRKRRLELYIVTTSVASSHWNMVQLHARRRVVEMWYNTMGEAMGGVTEVRDRGYVRLYLGPGLLSFEHTLALQEAMMRYWGTTHTPWYYEISIPLSSVHESYKSWVYAIPDRFWANSWSISKPIVDPIPECNCSIPNHIVTPIADRFRSL